mmetsp:Transcript_27615/g.57407  ORF Transcript_27615/g.57407 Transcript_27615/m.57407 type:complete len:200 (+) Transcript_27615:626-1225(+)
MLPYTEVEEKNHRNFRLGLWKRSSESWMYSAARCFPSYTPSNFSQVWFGSMESCRMPAEWMKPMTLGAFLENHLSQASCEPMSILPCSTLMPMDSALASIVFHLGMLRSEIFMDRERNSMVNFGTYEPPLAAWIASALSRIHSPMTRPRAPLPPEIPMMPSAGSSNSLLATWYVYDGSCRNTKRPAGRPVLIPSLTGKG